MQRTCYPLERLPTASAERSRTVSEATRLLASAPPLKKLGVFVRALENKHAIKLQCVHAAVSSTIPEAEAAVRSWLFSL